MNKKLGIEASSYRVRAVRRAAWEDSLFSYPMQLRAAQEGLGEWPIALCGDTAIQDFTVELGGIAPTEFEVLTPVAAPKLRVRRVTVEQKLRYALRNRFKATVPNGRTSTALQLSGISLAAVRQHLESLFQPGMTWDNYGFYGWHIDHKRPLASFVLPDQQAEAFHYTNLQPLWWRDNLSKGSKHV